MRRLSLTGLFFIGVLLSSSAQRVMLSPVDFYAALKANPNAQLLDLRADADFYNGHLKKARNFDYRLDEFEKFAVANFNKKEPLYIYCYTAIRSAEAQTFLREIGFTNVIELENGFANWTAESMPYVTSRPNTAPIAIFTMDNLKTTVRRDDILLVDFYSDQCVSCKDMKLVLKKVEQEEEGLKLLTIDAEKSDDIIAHYNITEIPTYLVFKNGRQVWRGSGLKTADELKQLIR